MRPMRPMLPRYPQPFVQKSIGTIKQATIPLFCRSRYLTIELGFARTGS